MVRYYVTKSTSRGRIKTTKFWLKKKKAQDYADLTNVFSKRSYARVVKG